MRDLSKLSDTELTVHAVVRLGFGALPIENWSFLFVPGLSPYAADEVLANKAFSVWFPTSLDFIGGEAAMADVQREARRRSLVHANRVFELYSDLQASLRSVAALLSREEQLFVRDRRLQNVHGNLDYFLSERPGVKWYDASRGIVVAEQIPEAELHFVILKPFNENIRESQSTLRVRVLNSPEWSRLYGLYRRDLTCAHLALLIHHAGVDS